MSARKQTLPVSRDERVERVARQMREGTWRRGMAAELAAEWGVPLGVAEKTVGEAAMVLRLSRKLFDEEARAEVLRRFGEHLKSA